MTFELKRFSIPRWKHVIGLPTNLTTSELEKQSHSIPRWKRYSETVTVGLRPVEQKPLDSEIKI